MNIKLIVSAAIVGGALIYSGVKPSELLDRGSSMWEEFSGDFMAIFSEEGVRDMASKEAEAHIGRIAEVVCDTEPAAMDSESFDIEGDVKRTRCEAMKNAKVMLNPEELKQHLEERNRLLE